MTHVPVLLQEAVDGLRVRPDGTYLDGTFGRGGHSREILSRLGPAGRLLAMDRDPEAAAAARGVGDPRLEFCQGPFSGLEEFAARAGALGRLDGILLDLGVSSPQLDDAGRGFSFDHDGPLDMRMDPSSGESAADLVNGLGQDELAAIFRDFGEERFARRVAAAIVRRRAARPFGRTADLADTIAAAIPGREFGRHKATRCFQAIRIAVNHELDELHAALGASVRALGGGGRLCVISFHSLEDRMVKNFIRDSSEGAQIPRGLPLRADEMAGIRGRTAYMERVGGAVRPSEAELGRNPRARSATLRVAQRLGDNQAK
ncbi:MAG: 16S rRNA (cytosine(1402)-N(4))-methyltransferase RsmH [Succinivibrionaceae bacterium]|nr:16S rRNA (cytosine(1402)-N(4))-methyltransferase RsmH [Succinivibrionaceae bacterium]